MNITPVFSNFVATDQLDTDNDTLVAYAFSLASKDSGVFVSNEGGWQSKDVSESEEMKSLISLIEDRINILHTQIGLNNKFKQVISNIWININRHLNYNRAHMHPHSCFSGVYYVKASDRAGCLEMMNPVSSFFHVIPSDSVGQPGPFNSQLCSLPPTPGMLVMFPSWLMHYTQPNLSNDDRISIAFNTMLVEIESTE